MYINIAFSSVELEPINLPVALKPMVVSTDTVQPSVADQPIQLYVFHFQVSSNPLLGMSIQKSNWDLTVKIPRDLSSAFKDFPDAYKKAREEIVEYADDFSVSAKNL